ncbi:MBL fold metallo-hydrolase [Mycolicibacter arupensis]|jgi:L-ascorbate metabolism protein UlaG (beta-lactamase superfamily)|uniref:MBL fold metallo-hydrolase n=1 Tax=Mycolicibacter arupensis TaxID=342002 RepID=A0A0F5MRI7_9MYCO|nr:MBL fold metallo-hydrolase [Mycolicibacter arupensis]KAA1431610.1 MBL fold metallo-hydrolase [Mycolicibacter arupensis]KKB97443.1 metallo-beta-lactamase [Mycolicibacter arupensis]MCV7274202.1 MBL fold metallo-hydrolase [Mycolicibacter arupensis]OQZ94674.1 MBL fold metallo-hydrolase [Mycolicibacter arupensis]TXI54793.1 MAG: MBL fold metallo-hydrolase [Mycolicibacter arupensis]
MRLKLGRPDIGRYADRFDVTPAQPDAPVSVTWLGVTTMLIDDGSSALMTDGYFSRPSLARVALRKVAPSAARIDGALARAGARELAAVIPLHSHIDHALDSAVVAERTGAALVGGESTANVGRGQGLSADRVIVATPGAPITLGAYEVTLIESRHCPPDRFPGVINRPVVPPVKASAYKCGEAWSALVAHRGSGRNVLIMGSAGFIPGALAGRHAEVVYLGIGQLGIQPRQYLIDYWNETVRAVGASTVVLTHWDDFFSPLSKPLRALPYAGDDLHATMRVLSELAETDGVGLHLPTVWRREDPWA